YSTVPNVVSIPAARTLMLSFGISSSSWPARTPVGVTIGLQAHWPTSVTTSRIRPSEIFSSGTASRRRRYGEKPQLEGLHLGRYGGSGRHRLLHGRSPNLARSRYLLRVVLPPPAEPPRHCCRHHPSPHRGLDHSNRPQSCRRDHWHPALRSLSA